MRDWAQAHARGADFVGLATASEVLGSSKLRRAKFWLCAAISLL